MSVTISISLLPESFEAWVDHERGKGHETRASFMRRLLLKNRAYQNWMKENEANG